MAATEIILLERVENLGQMGDVVTVKPGYARNFLLPEGKALRASKENLAYFEGQRKALEQDNAKKKTDAEKRSGKIDGAKVALIRAASEAGQLYGSVNSRDIAEAVSAETGETVARNQVIVNQNYKTIGLFPVDVMLHAEVKVSVTVNIARSTEEAKIQAETGKALIADAQGDVAQEPEEVNVEEQLAEALEQDALEAEVARQAEEAEQAAEEAAKAEAKSEARAAKKAEKAVEEEPEEAATEIGTETTEVAEAEAEKAE